MHHTSTTSSNTYTKVAEFQQKANPWEISRVTCHLTTSGLTVFTSASPFVLVREKSDTMSGVTSSRARDHYKLGTRQYAQGEYAEAIGSFDRVCPPLTLSISG